MNADAPTPAAFFEAKFRADPDPWGFATSPYELAKYAATLAALPHRRYRSALEIGCANGVLTRQLAARCDTLLAVDYAENALARARARCHDRPWLSFARCAVPEQFPAGRFDLIVLSEVGYYLSTPQLCGLRTRMVAALPPGGHVLLVHWTPRIEDRPLTGDGVHALLRRDEPRLRHVTGGRAPNYRLDLLERRR